MIIQINFLNDFFFFENSENTSENSHTALTNDQINHGTTSILKISLITFLFIDEVRYDIIDQQLRAFLSHKKYGLRDVERHEDVTKSSSTPTTRT